MIIFEDRKYVSITEEIEAFMEKYGFFEPDLIFDRDEVVDDLTDLVVIAIGKYKNGQPGAEVLQKDKKYYVKTEK